MDKGSPLYQVDARKKGTTGKRESFTDLDKAKDRAKEIAESLTMEGIEGMAIKAELRVAAIQGERLLAEYNKTLSDAVQFYLAHLKSQAEKDKTHTISFLADKWLADRTADKNKPAKKKTLIGIKEGAKMLKAAFGECRIAEVTKKDIEDYLQSLERDNQTKRNKWSLIRQFFNYCIKNGYFSSNPAKGIVITIPSKDIQILPLEKVQQIFDALQTTDKHKDLMPYFAVSIFAGLRPTEAQLLTWERINLDTREIHVLASTSKVGESRIVKIEDTLLHWLKEYKGEKKGLIVPAKNFTRRFRRFRADIGYKMTNSDKKVVLNPDSVKWTQDVMRHTFGSYHLGKYHDRAHLAELMGNSIEVIKKHYKVSVSEADTKAFWNILPASQQKQKKEQVKRIVEKIRRKRGSSSRS